MNVLEKESESAIDWFKVNDIVNPDELQAMIMSCDKENKNVLDIDNSIISSVDSVTF